ncbi:MAG: tRNA (cytidine(56)-2'-O)-methyltransferase [archaeon]
MLKVLRLGHRRERDKRISTHVALAARAFGADEFILTGEKDEKLLETVRDVVNRFGGSFKTSYSKNWGKEVEKFSEKGEIIHLTMYGERIQNLKKEINGIENALIIVGGEKVPKKAYELSDYNISVTNQPHSEVFALAISYKPCY